MHSPRNQTVSMGSIQNGMYPHTNLCGDTKLISQWNQPLSQRYSGTRCGSTRQCTVGNHRFPTVVAVSRQSEPPVCGWSWPIGATRILRAEQFWLAGGSRSHREQNKSILHETNLYTYAEMANRTNKPNRTFPRSCSVRVRKVRTTPINCKYESKACYLPSPSRMYIVQLCSGYRVRLRVDLSVKYTAFAILELQRKWKHVFSGPNGKLGCVHIAKMKILADYKKIKSQTAYCSSPRKRKLIWESIDKLYRLGIVQPSCKSEFLQCKEEVYIEWWSHTNLA